MADSNLMLLLNPWSMALREAWGGLLALWLCALESIGKEEKKYLSFVEEPHRKA